MILITGGAGYIGSHVLKKLKELNYEVIVFDNLETGHSEVVEETLGTKLIRGDLRRPETLEQLNDYEIDACMHFAAYASVGESVKFPEKYFDNNLVGSLNLIQYLNKRNCKKFILSSTSEVYGEAEYLPIDEGHTLKPVNPYGLSKRMVEEVLEWFDKAYGMRFVALRYFNAAGCSLDGKIGELHEPENHLIPNAVLGALEKKEFMLTCSKVDTPDKTPIRDFVHVEDLADAHVEAYEYLCKGNDSNYFNLGTGTGYSVLQVVEAVEKICKVEIKKNYGEIREGEPARKYASNQKAKDVLKWNPKYNIDDMVQTTYEFLKRNT